MIIDQPQLFIDIDDKKIVFVVVVYDKKLDFKILKTICINSAGVKKGKIIDIDISSNALKKTIHQIEEEINYIFNNATIVINPSDINCLNVSGYKKLSGSQVSEEDVSFILNEVKELVSQNETKYTLIHLFNSSFSIDSDNLENLPLGLFGEFYNQNMTFFLVDKNSLKNIKLVLNKCGVDIKRIILKPFVEGVNYISKNKLNTNFALVKLYEDRCSISIFKNKSFVFSEEFNFGTDLLIKDLSKLCSIKFEEAYTILREVDLLSLLLTNDEEYLDKKYFKISPFRKIKIKLVIDIINARLEELFEILYKKNINLNHLKSNNKNIYISIESEDIEKNIKKILLDNISDDQEINFNESLDEKSTNACVGAVELSGKGWEKEAIPVGEKKKSIISRIFSALFN